MLRPRPLIEACESRTLFSVGLGNASGELGTTVAAVYASANKVTKAAKPPKPTPTPSTTPVFSYNDVNGTLSITNVINAQVNEPVDGTIEYYDKKNLTNGQPTLYTYTGVTTVVIAGTSGADTISMGVYTVNVDVNAIGGNDTLIVSNNGLGYTRLNDVSGTNSFTVSNNGGGTFEIYTNASSTVSKVGTGPVSIYRNGVLSPA